MKSKIVSFVLCIAVIAATVWLVRFEAPLNQGENPTMPETTPEETTPSTETVLVSRNYVIQTAHDAEDFVTRLAYSNDKEFENYIRRLTPRLEECARYLKDELQDYYGASYFSKISDIFQDVLTNPFTNSESFGARVGKVLTELENTYPKNGADANPNDPVAPMYYPKFDTDANGTTSLAMLTIYRQQLASKENSIFLTFGGNLSVGDTLLGADAPDSFKNQQAATSYAFPLYQVSSVLNTDTASFANLTSPLTESISAISVSGAVKGSPSYAPHLKNAGIDVLSVSDRNLLSYGEIGKSDTLDALNNAGIVFSDEGSVAFYQTSLGPVAYLTYDIINEIQGNVNVTYRDTPKNDIAAAKNAGAKFVIVHFNWINLEKNQWDPCMGQVNSARAAVDSGADLVIGSLPNALAAVEQYKGVNILYCPGNLSQRQGEDTVSFLFQQEFSLDANGNPIHGEIQIFPLSGSSSSDGVPRLVLDAAGSSEFRSTIIHSSSTLRYGVNKRQEFPVGKLNIISVNK